MGGTGSEREERVAVAVTLGRVKDDDEVLCVVECVVVCTWWALCRLGGRLRHLQTNGFALPLPLLRPAAGPHQTTISSPFIHQTRKRGVIWCVYFIHIFELMTDKLSRLT